MIEDLAELDSRIVSTSAVAGKIVFLREPFEETKKESKAASAPTPSKIVTLDAVKYGDLLYAVIDTGVNSNVPSDVRATVTSETYRNVRLTGGFQRHDEKPVLSFSRMIYWMEKRFSSKPLLPAQSIHISSPDGVDLSSLPFLKD